MAGTMSQIREDMKVMGSDGQHVGTVDKVEGNNIKLTKNDPNAQGQHHFISMDLVDSVDQNGIRLNVSSQDAMSQWQTGGNTMSQGAGAGNPMGGSSSKGNLGSMGGTEANTDTMRDDSSKGYK